MPKLKGILETSLYVSDIQRAVDFYRDVLNLEVVGEFEADRGAAMRAGESILLLFRADVTSVANELPAHGTEGEGHIAFSVESEDLADWREKLRDWGIEIEAEIEFANHEPSIYFRDPDRNSIELAVADIWPR